MEIIRKNKMKVLKMKSIVKRNQSAFNGLLNRLNSAKKRRQVDRNYPNQNTVRKQNENNRTEQNIQELWDNIKGSNILITGITEIREWNKNM